MNTILKGAVFSCPRPLSHGQECEVWRASARWPGNPKPGNDCVLKFFSRRARTLYLKELDAYDHLKKTCAPFRFPTPFGYDEWMQAKYVKFYGRAGNHHLKADPEAMIDVLMWEYIPHSTRLSELVPIPVNIAKRALSRLLELHSVNIMHGNVSLSNALLLVDHDSSNVLWIDFTYS